MIGHGHPAQHGHHPHLGQVPGGGAGAGGGGGGGGGIPQASVRPLVRPVIMNSDKHQDLHDNDVKPPISSKYCQHFPKSYSKQLFVCIGIFRNVEIIDSKEFSWN